MSRQIRQRSKKISLRHEIRNVLLINSYLSKCSACPLALTQARSRLHHCCTAPSIIRSFIYSYTEPMRWRSSSMLLIVSPYTRSCNMLQMF